MKIGIVGAGLIGRKRALALPQEVAVKTICDLNLDLAKKFAADFKCNFTDKIKDILNDPEIDAIFVATPNGSLSKITESAILAKKHVLVEKPGALNTIELETVKKAFEQNPTVVRYGYNHRLHPGIQKAKVLVDSKQFGEVLFIRAKYGHGGRLGYEKEWRFKKELSGGGELIDQGSHLIDLTNFFIGETSKIKSSTKTFFWKTPLEDTAFMILENDQNQVASLAVSCVEWKNLFSFELMLKTAKIQIDGLGGSYGTEKLTLYKMKPEMGPPEIEEFVFEQPDKSWQLENEKFFLDIKYKNYSAESINQAIFVLKTIEKIYKDNN